MTASIGCCTRALYVPPLGCIKADGYIYSGLSRATVIAYFLGRAFITDFDDATRKLLD